ncbi:MAG: FAD-dependent monooxygenase, partial [Nitrososphaerales archaeon]|nr:FAD-dependent monooxygenase [Nitrososphaerales archaeon]
MESFDVIVVGGGIGGLAVGYKLASDGYRVCILEARQGYSRSKRGVGLQPNGLAALERLGLLAEAIEIGARSRYVAWYSLDRKLLAKFDWSILDHPQNYLLTVIPSELESLIRSRFASRGGLLYTSTSFTSVARDEKGVKVKAQTSGVQSEYYGKILVGADGENSTVRASLEIPTRIKEYPDHFILMLLRRTSATQDEGRQYFDRGRMIGILPAHDSTYIFYYIREGRFDGLKMSGLEAFKQQLLSIEPEIKDQVNSLTSWDDVLHVKPKRVDASSWVADRVALLGDAVHALNPSLGQGLNMTLVDAVTLAGVIDSCFKSNDFSARSLKRYENSRRRSVQFIQAQAEVVARLYDTESRLFAWYAKRLLRKAAKSRNQMRLAVEIAAGLRDRL